MDLSWFSAILVGAGCLALGYCIGTRRPFGFFLRSTPKVVLVVRNDLKMGKGKIAAQCSHATLGLYKKLLHREPKALNRWEICAQPKVVVKIESEEDMLVLQESAKSLKLPTHITIDAGRTQIAPNSRTVMAILGCFQILFSRICSVASSWD